LRDLSRNRKQTRFHIAMRGLNQTIRVHNASFNTLSHCLSGFSFPAASSPALSPPPF
jgi:hypothetical protein